MKPVFKCDYCDFMGTEEEVVTHEVRCEKNYDRKNCLTCANRDGIKSVDDEGWTYKCKEGMDIPANHIYEHCVNYEREEKSNLTDNIFVNGLFGGFRGF